MLKGSIAFQLSEKFVVGDHGLVAALGDNSKVIQILKELFVVADGKNYRCPVTMLVGEVLQCLAHGWQITPPRFDVEVAQRFPVSNVEG